jgi:hypothetical protein
LAAGTKTAFISYSREDAEFALRLAEDLKAAAAAVWLDQLDIAPGQRWAKAVQDALNDCPRMLVILSPASANSTNVDDEVSFALEEKKTVVPVLYRECRIPFRLRPIQYVDFTHDYDRGLKSLVRVLIAELRMEHGLADPKQTAPVISEPIEARSATESDQTDTAKEPPDRTPEVELFRGDDALLKPVALEPDHLSSARQQVQPAKPAGQEWRLRVDPWFRAGAAIRKQLFAGRALNKQSIIPGAIAAFVLILAVLTVIIYRHRAATAAAAAAAIESQNESPTNKAVRLRKKCDAGNAYSCYYVGQMYEIGEGVEQDKSLAIAYHQKACKLNSSYDCDQPLKPQQSTTTPKQ